MTELGPRAGKPFILNGWHVLAIFVAFFGSVLVVNIAFIMRAYATFPGEVSAQPFEDGIAYNSEIHRREAAAALGWRAELQQAGAGHSNEVVLRVRDASGKAVTGLRFLGALERTVTTSDARKVELREAQPGEYRVKLNAPAGLWDLDVKAAAPGGRTFELEQRLVL